MACLNRIISLHTVHIVSKQILPWSLCLCLPRMLLGPMLCFIVPDKQCTLTASHMLPLSATENTPLFPLHSAFSVSCCRSLWELPEAAHFLAGSKSGPSPNKHVLRWAALTCTVYLGCTVTRSTGCFGISRVPTRARLEQAKSNCCGKQAKELQFTSTMS